MVDNRLFDQDTMTAPWGLNSRLKLVALACGFFNANKIKVNHEAIGKEPANPESPSPLSVSDFLKYLEMTKAFPRQPNVFHVARIMEKMVSSGLLERVGQGDSSIGASRTTTCTW